MFGMQIMHAKSCSDLYRVVGEDFWLATWCNSTAFEGYVFTVVTVKHNFFDIYLLFGCSCFFRKQLEGTRITVVKM